MQKIYMFSNLSNDDNHQGRVMASDFVIELFPDGFKVVKNRVGRISNYQSFPILSLPCFLKDPANFMFGEDPSLDRLNREMSKLKTKGVVGDTVFMGPDWIDWLDSLYHGGAGSLPDGKAYQKGMKFFGLDVIELKENGIIVSKLKHENQTNC